MFPYVEGDLELRPLTQRDVGLFFAFVEMNHDHLDRWLNWSARVKTVQDATAYIKDFEARWRADEGFHAGIWNDGRFAGGVICYKINRRSNKSEIGYWLGRDYMGKGLITRSCKAVIDHLFGHYKLHRVEIQAGRGNMRSLAVAERLGFTQEGVKRESEWITDRYVDHVIYGLLAHEWAEKQVKREINDDNTKE